jgi:hypothetical protein
LRFVQVVLSDKRVDVCVNNLRHFLSPVPLRDLIRRERVASDGVGSHRLQDLFAKGYRHHFPDL